ncbi:NPCBM/NEW2 domain-containing protein [Nocardia sp. AG03]|uniref:NPCBM/NEW2 domain-containing protein n=1 Tax=Nocardia sp. AG03 TaxID=3025312 RepID=UPI002418149F|nr:NPCBM/NEW2 domain-containing protein [Nocardia sp. AG03]
MAALANAEGAWSFLERLTSDSTSSSPGSTEERALPSAPSVATTSVPVTSMATSAMPAPTVGWYDLTAYRAVSWNNGFDPVDPVRIGAASFPASIVGFYPSTSSDPMDRAIWTVGGKCDRFSVWIGKDADSSSSDGVGRFVVQTDDREAFAAEMSMADAAREVALDITGAIRLTLLDTRRSQDAKNAWGQPRVHCTEPPGRKR